MKTSNEARQGSRRAGHSLERANQYDKAEELITWSTFAPLLKLDGVVRDGIIVEILKAGLGRDFNEYLDEGGFAVEYERHLPSPSSYLARIQTTSVDHPVKYVRDSVKDKKILEGNTQVDVLFENSKMLVLGEVKFMSDISCQVRYDPVRNQLARLIDVGLTYRGQRKLAVVLFSPEWGYNTKNRLYYYKLREYHEASENIMADIPHRPLKEITESLLGVGWVPLEQAASLIHKAAIDDGLEQQEDVSRFYRERRIQLTI